MKKFLLSIFSLVSLSAVVVGGVALANHLNGGMVLADGLENTETNEVETTEETVSEAEEILAELQSNEEVTVVNENLSRENALTIEDFVKLPEEFATQEEFYEYEESIASNVYDADGVLIDENYIPIDDPNTTVYEIEGKWYNYLGEEINCPFDENGGEGESDSGVENEEE